MSILCKRKFSVVSVLIVAYGVGWLFLLSVDKVSHRYSFQHELIFDWKEPIGIQREVPVDRNVHQLWREEKRRYDSAAKEDHVPLWESDPYSSLLPDWAKAYFAWHRDSLRILNETNTKWDSYRYLVVRCLRIDQKCGGLSDRLQSIPLALLLASLHQRLLFIEWEKPAPLPEFLEPVAIDWRLPSWLHKVSSLHDRLTEHGPFVHFERSPSIVTQKHFHRLQQGKNDTRIMDMRYQSHEHGSTYYNAFVLSRNHTRDLLFADVFWVIWGCFFRPSPPIQGHIDNAMNQLGLYRENDKGHESNYVSLHVRLLYFKDKSNDTARVSNALHCASQLGANSTLSAPPLASINTAGRSTRQLPIIFVASDSSRGADYATEYGQRVMGRHVVRWTGFNATTASIRATDALHLDRGSEFVSKTRWSNWKDFDVSSFYGIFVDLYVLSHGRCVAYNIGGFGYLASLITRPSRSKYCESKSYARDTCARNSRLTDDVTIPI